MAAHEPNPSAELSSATTAQQLEHDSVPVHFPGMVSYWPALQLWRGESGLQRLIQLAGGAQVEVLVSAGERQVGDMQHLVLLGCTLRDFLDGSLERQVTQRQPAGSDPLRLYLAQSPICRAARVAGGGSGDGAGGELQPAALHALMEDLGVPALVQQVQLSQVNLWASMRPTSSSLHYDPYSNLLCVVRGCKRVWLAPPSCTPHLTPQPLTSESANHSPANLAHPDLARFPGLAAALGRVQVFEVPAGDALFIPEGWWHQVDSTDGTLGVNFWWEGELSRRLGGHMDRYLFRRLAQSLLEQRKRAALASLPRCDLLAQAAALDQGAGLHAEQQQQGGHHVGSTACTASAAATPREQAAGAKQTHALLPEQAAAVRLLAAALAAHQQTGSRGSGSQQVTAVIATLAATSAQAVLEVLLQLRRQHPQLAAHLLLEGLDPAGWELLSAAFDQHQEDMAAAGQGEAAEDAVAAVCDELYSVVDRQQLLDVILARKQAFARQALQEVLQTELAGCF